jgi:hypothetical protein
VNVVAIELALVPAASAVTVKEPLARMPAAAFGLGVVAAL